LRIKKLGNTFSDFIIWISIDIIENILF
jgi:hypothetical protein